MDWGQRRRKLCKKIRMESICWSYSIVEEEEFKLVKNYIKIHYGANINEVSKNTGVPVNKILKYVREGKLSTL